MRCSLVNTGTLTRYDSLPGTGALLPRSGAPPLARRRRRLARWLSRRRPSSLLRRDGARQARPNLPECQRAANVPTVTHSTAPAPVEAVSDAGSCARAGLTRVLCACLRRCGRTRALLATWMHGRVGGPSRAPSADVDARILEAGDVPGPLPAVG